MLGWEGLRAWTPVLKAAPLMLRPHQVYEQLYDTLDITGSAEIRAHATAKVGISTASLMGPAELAQYLPDVRQSWFLLCDFCQISTPLVLLLIHNLF